MHNRITAPRTFAPRALTPRALLLTALASAALLANPATAQTTAQTSAPPARASAAPATAARPAPATPAPAAAPAYVQLTTARGTILVELDVARAPISARNFLRYVDARRFDGVSFYRALNLGQGYGLIQAGTRGAPAITYPPIAHEPTSRTGLSHIDGAISFARAAPGSANGDFFITIGALTSLDAQPAGSGGDPAGFAVFGRIVAGMDTVRAILAAPTDPNAGVGVMRGQMIAAPIRITTARRVAAPPPAPPATVEPPIAGLPRLDGAPDGAPARAARVIPTTPVQPPAASPPSPATPPR